MKSPLLPFPAAWLRVCAGLLLLVVLTAAAPVRASLLIREDWAESPFALPVTQEHVASPELTLHLYGGAVTGLKKSHHEEIANDPYYLWSGEITSSWLASLSHDRGAIDATGGASIRWLTRQSGAHSLRLALKLGSGAWIVSGPLVGESADWIETSHPLDQMAWFALAVGELIVLGGPVAQPDLSAVAEIGFTDLKAGGGSAASSRIDWLELHVADDCHLCGIQAIRFSPGSCQNDPGVLLDGNPGTRWFAEGEQEWVAVELNRPMRIHGLDLAWYRGAERFALFQVEVSSDGEAWIPVLGSTASSGLTGGTELHLFEPVLARQVRVLGWGNEINAFNSLSELRLRGRELAPAWWEAAPVRHFSEEWRDSAWMGWISTRKAPWIYHAGMGWFFTSSAADNSVWVWDPQLDWMWTNKAAYPYFYRHADGAWLWFMSGPQPRWFFNHQTGLWEASSLN